MTNKKTLRAATLRVFVLPMGFTAFLSYAHYMPEQKKNQLRKRKILFLMSYREKMEKKIPQDKKTVL